MATYVTDSFAMLPCLLMDAAPRESRPEIWAVYMVMHRRGWGSSQGCWASVPTISDESGVGRHSVRSCIRWLIEAGWLVREERPGSTSVYRVKVEAPDLATQQRKRPSRKRDTPSKTGRAPLPKLEDHPFQDWKTTPSKTGRAPLPKLEDEPYPSNQNPLTREDVEPPLSPASGGTDRPEPAPSAVSTSAVYPVPQQQQQGPPPFASGTFALVPQPQQPASSVPNAQSPAPPDRVKRIAPTIPSPQPVEAASWPVQAPLVALAPPPAGEKPASRQQRLKDDPCTGKQLPLDVIPLDMRHLADLLIEFWAVKKGVRSASVFGRIIKSLRQWSDADQESALADAISSGWGNVFPPKGSSSGRSGWATKQSATSEAFAEVSAFLNQLEAI